MGGCGAVRDKEMTLTPLAVRVDRQRVGIGKQLVKHAAGVDSPWRGDSAFMVRASTTPQGRLVMPSVIAEAH